MQFLSHPALGELLTGEDQKVQTLPKYLVPTLIINFWKNLWAMQQGFFLSILWLIAGLLNFIICLNSDFVSLLPILLIDFQVSKFPGSGGFQGCQIRLLYHIGEFVSFWMLTFVNKYWKLILLFLWFCMGVWILHCASTNEITGLNWFVFIICSTLTQTLILKIRNLQRPSLMPMMMEQQKLLLQQYSGKRAW
jgi:hypothetical protein